MTIYRKDYDNGDWVIFKSVAVETYNGKAYIIGDVLESKQHSPFNGIKSWPFLINDHVQLVKRDSLTEEQTTISNFLIEQATMSDSTELDLWIAYLARQNGDELLATAIEGGEYDEETN